MENQNNQDANNFFELINTEQSSMDSGSQSNYSSKLDAEKVIIILSQVILCGGVIVAAIIFIHGIITLFNIDYFGEKIWLDYIIRAVLVAMAAAIQWAMIHVVVNISRNLFKINETLNELKNNR